MELTDESPIIGQPKDIIMPLTRYQKAILYKALIEIEKKNMGTGFMGDKPGAGKSAAILSLIVADRIVNKNSQTILVVPQNLLSQWSAEIKKFCSKNVKFSVVSEYSQVLEFYDSDNAAFYKTHDILLVTSSMYNALRDVMISVKYSVKRVVFDEVDTVENLFDNIVIGDIRSKKNEMFKEFTTKEFKFNDMTWYVSASISNLFEDDYFTLGKIKMSLDEFNKYYIKCSDEFIAKHTLNKYGEKSTEEHCDSVADIYCDYLSVEQLGAINSLSFNKIAGEYSGGCAKSEFETIKIIVNDYQSHSEKIKQDIDYKSEKIKEFAERNKNTTVLDKLLKKDIASLEFYTGCLKNFYDLLNVKDYPEFVETYKNTKVENDKLTKILNYLKQCKHEKVIIFSDYSDGFNHFVKFFNENEIKYTDLGKGNLKEIDQAIKDYKHGDTKYLLIDSASEGCGLNLENTDAIIFVHRIDETLKEQMVGRALRAGRKSELEVITFLNKNEIV